MNLLILHPEDYISENLVGISGRRFEHVKNVLKANAGTSVKAGALNGLCGDAVIVQMHADRAVLSVSLLSPPPRKSGTILVMSMIRPKAFRRSLFAAVCMGVDEVHVIRSWRVEKSYFDSPMLSREAVNETILLALEQSKDTVPPKFSIHPLFKPFVQDVLPGLSAGCEKILCHPYDSQPLPVSIDSRKIVMIGPEGGFIGYEVNLAKEAGFSSYSFGERILTSENAVCAVLGRISSL